MGISNIYFKLDYILKLKLDSTHTVCTHMSYLPHFFGDFTIVCSDLSGAFVGCISGSVLNAVKKETN